MRYRYLRWMEDNELPHSLCNVALQRVLSGKWFYFGFKLGRGHDVQKPYTLRKVLDVCDGTAAKRKTTASLTAWQMINPDGQYRDDVSVMQMLKHLAHSALQQRNIANTKRTGGVTEQNSMNVSECDFSQPSFSKHYFTTEQLSAGKAVNVNTHEDNAPAVTNLSQLASSVAPGTHALPSVLTSNDTSTAANQSELSKTDTVHASRQLCTNHSLIETGRQASQEVDNSLQIDFSSICEQTQTITPLHLPDSTNDSDPLVVVETNVKDDMSAGALPFLQANENVTRSSDVDNDLSCDVSSLLLYNDNAQTLQLQLLGQSTDSLTDLEVSHPVQTVAAVAADHADGGVTSSLVAQTQPPYSEGLDTFLNESDQIYCDISTPHVSATSQSLPPSPRLPGKFDDISSCGSCEQQRPASAMDLPESEALDQFLQDLADDSMTSAVATPSSSQTGHHVTANDPRNTVAALLPAIGECTAQKRVRSSSCDAVMNSTKRGDDSIAELCAFTCEELFSPSTQVERVFVATNDFSSASISQSLGSAVPGDGYSVSSDGCVSGDLFDDSESSSQERSYHHISFDLDIRRRQSATATPARAGQSSAADVELNENHVPPKTVCFASRLMDQRSIASIDNRMQRTPVVTPASHVIRRSCLKRKSDNVNVPFLELSNLRRSYSSSVVRQSHEMSLCTPSPTAGHLLECTSRGVTVYQSTPNDGSPSLFSSPEPSVKKTATCRAQMRSCKTPTSATKKSSWLLRPFTEQDASCGSENLFSDQSDDSDVIVPSSCSRIIKKTTKLIF